jgi:hypothetical protein
LDTWGSCPGVKWLGWEADHSTAYYVEVKKEHSYNPTLAYTFMPYRAQLYLFPLLQMNKAQMQLNQCDYHKRCT